MLNRIIFTIIFAIFFATSAAFALSDADFNALIASSPEFKAEDQKLGKIYKELMGELKGEDKTRIRNDQRKWLKSELDAEAKGYMSKGMSKAQAYTKAFRARYNQLRVTLENSRLSAEDIAEGRAKPDDFYNDSEEDETPIAAHGYETFFAKPSAIMEMAESVISESANGGMQGQLKRSSESLKIGQAVPAEKDTADKYAWLFAVHAAMLSDFTMTPDEAKPYRKAIATAMMNAASSLGVPQDKLQSFMEATVNLLSKASKSKPITPESKQANQAPKQIKQDKEPVIAATDAVTEIENNLLRFDKAYKNKRITISGKMVRVEERDGKYLVFLEGAKNGNPFKQVRCEFDSSHEDSVLNLNKGDDVKISGHYKGKVDFMPMPLNIFDCSLQ